MIVYHHILLIEEAHDEQLFFKDAVEQLHPALPVTICKNGLEGLKALRKIHRSVDIIFVDLHIPFNGFQLLENLMYYEAYTRIVKVALGASVADEMRAYSCGADCFMLKEYLESNFCNRLEKVLSHDFKTGRIFIPAVD